HSLLRREDLHDAPITLGRRHGCDVEETRGAETCRATLARAAQRERAGACERLRDSLCELERRVAFVAGERLVATVADERDGDVLASRLADQEERQRGFVPERLVE